MTARRERLGRQQDTLRPTLCAPYRHHHRAQGSAPVAGTGPGGGSVADGTERGSLEPGELDDYPLTLDDNGDIPVNWSNEDYKKINERVSELQKERERTLRGTGELFEEERNLFLVYFDRGQSSVIGQDDVIMRALKAIARYPDCMIQISGHTDGNGGSPSANERLSASRAASVAAKLRRNGIPGDRLDLFAHGSNKSRLTSSKGAQADQLNRRVEIRIMPDG